MVPAQGFHNGFFANVPQLEPGKSTQVTLDFRDARVDAVDVTVSVASSGILSVTPPFISLGNVKRGDGVIAPFGVLVPTNAAPGSYDIAFIVTWKEGLFLTRESEQVRTTVEVTSPSPATTLGSGVGLGIIVVLLLVVALVIYTLRRRTALRR